MIISRTVRFKLWLSHELIQAASLESADVNEVTPSHKFERIRSVLDVIATVAVLAAAIAVLALTASTWNERRVESRASANQSLAALPPRPPDVPQSISDSPTIGAPDAQLVVIEYADFQCPYCAQFAKDVWPLLKSQYVDTGSVRFAFKHLPLDSHPHSRTAALGAECAHRQGRFTDMRELLLGSANQTLSANSSLEAARQLGLDLSAFRKCVNETDSAARIESDVNSARDIGVVATPWFLIGRVTDGGLVAVERVLVGMTSFESFEAVLDELNAAGRTAR